MDRLANRLDDAAATLATMDRRVVALTVGNSVFGTGTAGLPGRLGRELHAHWTAVLDARSREAAGVAARVAQAASSVRTTARQYTEADEAARHRLRREL